MFKRHNISTHTPWEEKVGYSRAVRIGPVVHVAGTMAADETGQMQFVGDAGAQTTYILEKIRRALEMAGTTMRDVVRVRIYVTNMDDQDAIGAAHAAVFHDIRPATTMVEVSRLASPNGLVEIEAEALIEDSFT